MNSHRNGANGNPIGRGVNSTIVEGKLSTNRARKESGNGKHRGGDDAHGRTTKGNESGPAFRGRSLSDAKIVIAVGKKEVVIEVDQLGTASCNGEPLDHDYERDLIGQLERSKNKPIFDFAQLEGLEPDDKSRVLSFLIRASQEEQDQDGGILSYLSGRPPAKYATLFAAALANLVGPENMSQCADALSMLADVAGQLPANLQDVAISRTRDRMKELKIETSLITATIKNIKATSKKPPQSEVVSVADALHDHRIDTELVVPAGWELTRADVRRRTAAGSVQVIPRPMWISGWHSSITEGGEQHVTVSYMDDFVEEQGRPGIARARMKLVSYTVPRLQIATSRTVVDLARFGYPVTSNNAADVVEYLAAFEHANRAFMPHSLAAEQFGWQGPDGKFGFLLGEQHLGAAQPTEEQVDDDDDMDDIDRELHEEEQLRRRREWRRKHPTVVFHGRDEGERQLAGAFVRRGTLAGWKEAVRPLGHYPAVQLGTYAGLAAPLIGVVHAQNFTLDYAGDSSGGKTTVLRIVASLYGLGGGEPSQQSVLRTCKATAVGIERTAALFNDLPVVLDETKLGDPNVLRELVYAIHSGQGRSRGTVQGLAATTSFRSVLMTSGESPIATIGTSDGGARVRVLTHAGPACGPKDEETGRIIDSLIPQLNEHCGHVGQRFIQFLVDNRPRWESWRKDYEANQEKHRRQAGNNNFAIRLAGYLALIDLAAAIAHELKLVPWKFADPVGQLWEKLTAEANDADRALAALQYAVSWFRMHSEEFQRHEYRRGEPVIMPADQPWRGLAGLIKRDSTTAISLLCFHPPRLEGILTEGRFDMQATIRSWKGRGWLQCDSGDGANTRATYSCRAGSETHRVYAVTGAAVKIAEGGGEPAAPAEDEGPSKPTKTKKSPAGNKAPRKHG